jgi:hypothetical protein
MHGSYLLPSYSECLHADNLRSNATDIYNQCICLKLCHRHSDARSLVTNPVYMSTSGSRSCTTELNARDHSLRRGSTHTCPLLRMQQNGLQFFTHCTMHNVYQQDNGLSVYLPICLRIVRGCPCRQDTAHTVNGIVASRTLADRSNMH